MFAIFKKKKKIHYEFVSIERLEPFMYSTKGGYHELELPFAYVIYYRQDGVMHSFYSRLTTGSKWDGASIPSIAHAYIGEPLDDMWAFESYIHDDLCEKDFIGEVRDKAFRALLKDNEVVMEEVGNDKVNQMYTAVVQYRTWKDGLFAKLSHWMGW